ncbi:MAG: UDP-2,3-diacylglucosamine diphosphatase [Steroidobacteraceae bacterium]
MTSVQWYAMHTLFVSDLHLDAAEPEALEQFLGWLAGPARAADCLYILGDLFEVWIGDDDRDPVRARACAALGQLAAQVPVYVMCGNRDFLLGPGFERRSGTRLISDPLTIDLYGERVLLTHGDLLCTADSSYQNLRSIVRRPGWQKTLRALPLVTRQVLADAARAGSRRHTQSTDEYIMDVNEAAVQAVLLATGVRTLIHGHTHRPGIHRYAMGKQLARRFVLGAWHHEGWCLRWNEDGSHLLHRMPRGPAAT